MVLTTSLTEVPQAEALHFRGRFNEYEVACSLQSAMVALHRISARVGGEIGELIELTSNGFGCLCDDLAAVGADPEGRELSKNEKSSTQVLLLSKAMCLGVGGAAEKAEHLVRDVSTLAHEAGQADPFEGFDGRISSLRQRVLAFMGNVHLVNPQEGMPGAEYISQRGPGDSFYKTVENPLFIERRQIFSELEELLFFVHERVAKLQGNILRLHLDKLVSDGLHDAAADSSPPPVDRSTADLVTWISDNLGDTNWQAGAGYVSRGVAVNRECMRGALGFLTSTEKMLENPRAERRQESWCYVAVARQVVELHTQAGAVSGDLTLLRELLDSQNPDIVNAALQQLQSFARDTDRLYLNGRNASFDTSVPEEYFANPVVVAREAMVTFLTGRAGSVDQPRKWVAAIQSFGIMGVKALCEIINNPSASGQLVSNCLEQLDEFFKDVSTSGLSHLSGKDQSFRNLYVQAISTVADRVRQYSKRDGVADDLKERCDGLFQRCQSVRERIADLRPFRPWREASLS